MVTRNENLTDFVVRKGRELFGEEFVYERKEATMHEGWWLKKVFGEKHEIRGVGFCHISIEGVWNEDYWKKATEMDIMETPDGPELVCNMVGFLQKEDIEKLREYPDCQFGERNNRLGLRASYKTFAGEWHRIHYFRTKNCTCAEVFLEAIAKYKYSARYKDSKIKETEREEHTEFIGAVWEQANSIFNRDSKEPLRTEFYPAFDGAEDLYYDNFLIWLAEEFMVQVHKHPEYQELVCEEPSRFWINPEYFAKKTYVRQRYIEKLQDIEADFIKTMMEADEKSVVLAAPNKEIPYMHVGELRVAASEASKTFFEKLKLNKRKAESLEGEVLEDEMQELSMQRLKDFY